MTIHKLANQKTYQRGVTAEKIAAAWMRFKGYKILEQRYKTAVGEIDLIARRENLMVFIEVKARRTKAEALESITPSMRARIKNVALYYISHHHVEGCDMRFDVVAITPLRLGDMIRARFCIHHLDNAW